MYFITKFSFGVGLENSIFYFEHEKFLSVCELLNIKFDDNVYQTDHVHSHNFYMQSLVERGVIGTIPRLYFYFTGPSLYLLILYL